MTQLKGGEPHLARTSHFRWGSRVKTLVDCADCHRESIVKVKKKKKISCVSTFCGMNTFLVDLGIRCFISF